jgi:hypothetical protein
MNRILLKRHDIAASNFLKETLAHGPMRVEEVKRLAKEKAQPWAPVKRMRKAVGVISKRTGPDPYDFEWLLPKEEVAKTMPRQMRYAPARG